MHSVDLLEPPSLRSLALDAAISLLSARFMIENRRRTSAKTQKRLGATRDGRGQVNSGRGFNFFACAIHARTRSPLLEYATAVQCEYIAQVAALIYIIGGLQTYDVDQSYHWCNICCG